VAAPENFRTNLQTVIDAQWEGNQAKVARAAKVARPYLNRVLRGHTEPLLGKAERLAHAVGFPLDALLGNPAEFSKAVLTRVPT